MLYVGAPHAAAMNFGTRAFWPPSEPIEAWVRRKMGGRIRSQIKEAKQERKAGKKLKKVLRSRGKRIKKQGLSSARKARRSNLAAAVKAAKGHKSQARKRGASKDILGAYAAAVKKAQTAQRRSRGSEKASRTTSKVRAQRKRMGPHQATKKRAKSSVTPYQRAVKGVAFLVARKISKKGIAPRHFFDKAMVRVEDGLKGHIDNELKRVK